MLQFVIKKVFGTRNDRVLKSIVPLVSRINELESSVKPLSDADLAGRTVLFKERAAKGESLESLLPEAFATVREAARRALNMRHFDVQLIGGVVLHRGMISEMKTGEGKTLVATLAAYLNALAGKGVHVVTVNDYLARRDSEWMGRIYRFLGLDVGVIYGGLPEQVKRAAYQADITYGQNNEFGFDYLRDNMKFDASDQMQRGHYFAIVDEVDSILIDEARTPLIISGPAEDATDKYYTANKIIPLLKQGDHFDIELRTKQPALTDSGVARVEELLGISNLYDPQNIELLHHVNQALRAYVVMTRDVDYVVKDGQVIIVDEFTGRLMPGRRWSDGLHQAVEAKEGLRIHRENQTLASITFQNFFRMYKKLSGMTGTADTEAVEFKQIYNLDVVIIPPNRAMVRSDESDCVYRSKREKYQAVVDDIREINKTGQPILVGTISIEQSEALSKALKSADVPHNVLNAKHHEREAAIIAQAGRYGAVTISTNMAGRGTDILLGGNPEFLAFEKAGTRDPQDQSFQQALREYTDGCAEERKKVLEAGGLFVMGTERHESRRIDNQLRGRAGRQGDPGRSRFYISFEDDLMKRFAGDRVQFLMNKFGWEEGQRLDGRIVSRSIENAQKRVEAYHFEMRKHVTEYDDVMNKQRQIVYNLRSKILYNDGIRQELLEIVDDLIETAVLSCCDQSVKRDLWKFEELGARFQFLFNRPIDTNDSRFADQQQIFDHLRNEARRILEERFQILNRKLTELKALFEEGANPFDFSLEELERDIFLRTLDHLWNQHLQAMDHLREGIGLRGYGQKNPLHEYQKEGFALFQTLIGAIREHVIRQLYYFELPEPREYIAHLEAEKKRREALARQLHALHAQGAEVPPAAAAPAAAAAAQPNAAPASAVEEEAGKSPDEQRARIAAQRRERRKLR